MSEEAEQAWVAMLEGNERASSATPTAPRGTTTTRAGPSGRRERLNGSGYPDGPVAYFHYIEAWRTSGQFAGLAFT